VVRLDPTAARALTTASRAARTEAAALTARERGVIVLVSHGLDEPVSFRTSSLLVEWVWRPRHPAVNLWGLDCPATCASMWREDHGSFHMSPMADERRLSRTLNGA
jgi:hypothetical protein